MFCISIILLRYASDFKIPSYITFLNYFRKHFHAQSHSGIHVRVSCKTPQNNPLWGAVALAQWLDSSAGLTIEGSRREFKSQWRRFETWESSFTPHCLRLSEETLQAVGPFYFQQRATEYAITTTSTTHGHEARC